MRYSLRLLSGNLLPLGTSASYAASLSRTVGTLNRARSSADALLQRARTAQEQAKAASQLASAHATAQRMGAALYDRLGWL